MIRLYIPVSRNLLTTQVKSIAARSGEVPGDGLLPGPGCPTAFGSWAEWGKKYGWSSYAFWQEFTGR